VIELLRGIMQGYEALAWPARLALVAGLPLLTFVLGLAVVVVLPADHFVRLPDPRSFWQRHVLLRTAVRVVRNVLGAIVLPLGVVMALPLVPGPGLVCILIGISLLDLPGKRRLERRLLAWPRVLHAVNQVRAWFGRAAVALPPEAVGRPVQEISQ
jgi:hypothetical protein